jgi:hypothetical protein
MEFFNSGAAKRLGAVLIVLGCIGLIASWNMDTTVEAGGERIGSREFAFDVPKTRVHNIGLMDDRRNYLLLSGLTLMVGVVTVGFGALAGNQSAPSRRQSLCVRCPKCNGILEGTPTLCTHCRTELGWVGGKAVTAEEAPLLIEQLREQERIQEEQRIQRLKEFEERRKQQAAEFKTLLKTLLSECWQVNLATVQQTGRLFDYAKAWYGSHRLGALQTGLRFRLGRRMYQSGLGDSDVIQQIAELTNQIDSPGQKAVRSWFLKRERRRLTLRLADVALHQDSPPTGVEADYQEAKAGDAKLNSACEHQGALRAALLPADTTNWRRVGIGYGLIILVIFVMLCFLSTTATGK